jgi:hypothetical protein
MDYVSVNKTLIMWGALLTFSGVRWALTIVVVFVLIAILSWTHSWWMRRRAEKRAKTWRRVCADNPTEIGIATVFEDPSTLPEAVQQWSCLLERAACPHRLTIHVGTAEEHAPLVMAAWQGTPLVKAHPEMRLRLHVVTAEDLRDPLLAAVEEVTKPFTLVLGTGAWTAYSNWDAALMARWTGSLSPTTVLTGPAAALELPYTRNLESQVALYLLSSSSESRARFTRVVNTSGDSLILAPEPFHAPTERLVPVTLGSLDVVFGPTWLVASAWPRNECNDLTLTWRLWSAGADLAWTTAPLFSRVVPLRGHYHLPLASLRLEHGALRPLPAWRDVIGVQAAHGFLGVTRGAYEGAPGTEAEMYAKYGSRAHALQLVKQRQV